MWVHARRPLTFLLLQGMLQIAEKGLGPFRKGVHEGAQGTGGGVLGPLTTEKAAHMQHVQVRVCLCVRVCMCA